MIAHRGGEIVEARGTALAHGGDGRGHQMHAEQIGHPFGQALLRQQLIVRQIDDEGRDPRAGAFTPSGKAVRVCEALDSCRDSAVNRRLATWAVTISFQALRDFRTCRCGFRRVSVCLRSSAMAGSQTRRQ
jgi:hypothetical protein